MDDQIERIKFASERAMRTLKNVTNTRIKNNSAAHRKSIMNERRVPPRIAAPPKPQQASKAESISMDETEAFVLEVLNSVGSNSS